jgi:hypothetical protein
MDYTDKLIPELSGWNNGDGIDVESWIRCVGRYDHAIGYASLFWPRFVVHDDCVFRYTLDKDTYSRWMDATGNDKRRVEAVVNHLHILDLFRDSEFQPNRDVILYVGSIFKDMWSCKLERDFPSRHFDVVFPDDASMELVDYEITFMQREQGRS